jgi:hypothetical protein
MSFLGLMLVSTHKAALRVAKADAFADGQADGRATAPKPIDRQPMINSLQGQLDAAVELKDGYAKTIDSQSEKLKRQAEIATDYIADAEKWRNRAKADRNRKQAIRDKVMEAKKQAPAKRASKSKAGAKK